VKVTNVRLLGASVLRLRSNAPHLTLVEVATDAGITGIGATWFSHHKVAPLLTQGRDSLAGMVVGEDPREPGRIWRAMFQRHWIDGALAIGAMGALDMALWDIAGKAQGLPVHALLGGAIQRRIMVYASASAFVSGSYEGDGPWVPKPAARLAAEARTYVEQGFRAIKFGWGNHFAPEDEERLAAIRTAIGPHVRLMIDFGCPAYWTPGWNAAAAIRAARKLERYDVFFFEEPMPAFDVEGHARVAEAVDVNVATGESLCAFHEFEPFIARRAVDVVQPDAMQMGITQLHRIARRAEEAGLLCIPHSPWSVFAATCHLHVLSTVSNGPLIEYPALASFDEGSLMARTTSASHYEIVETPPRLVDGYLELPAAPGLGLGQFVAEGIARLQGLFDGEVPA
jgi:L-alanine-DL-glutamate epimerase-like enolase superfamily enzyme